MQHPSKIAKKPFLFFLQGLFYLFIALILVQNCHCLLGTAENIVPIQQSSKPDILYKNIFIPDDFTATQIVDIKDALNEWAEKTNYSVHFNIFEHYNKSILKLLPYRSDNIVILTVPPEAYVIIEAEKEQAPGQMVLGRWISFDSVPTIYIVSSRMGENRVLYTSVVLHEVGHALGLDHNESTNSVMFHSQDKSAKHLTQADIDSFCHLHYCNPNKNP